MKRIVIRINLVLITLSAIGFAHGRIQYDIQVVKTDSAGNVEWTRTYGGSADDWASWITPTSDSGYVVVGTTESFDPKGVWLLKLDSNGDTVWTRIYGSSQTIDRGFHAVETGDGGYAVTGHTTVRRNKRKLRCVTWLLRLDRNGDTLWTRRYKERRLVWGQEVCQTPDGGYVILAAVCARYKGFALLKTDSSGNLLWKRRFRKGASESASMQMTLDQGFIVTGICKYSAWGVGDLWLVKTDSNGRQQWKRNYDSGKGTDYGYSVCETPDSGYVATGFCGGYQNKKNLSDFSFGRLCLLKTDSTGDTLWTRDYPYAEGRCIRQIPGGEYILVTQSGTLIKLDSVGNILWSRDDWCQDKYYIESCYVRPTNDDGYIIVNREFSRK